jgi:hypothetical protein
VGDRRGQRRHPRAGRPRSGTSTDKTSPIANASSDLTTPTPSPAATTSPRQRRPSQGRDDGGGGDDDATEVTRKRPRCSHRDRRPPPRRRRHQVPGQPRVQGTGTHLRSAPPTKRRPVICRGAARQPADWAVQAFRTAWQQDTGTGSLQRAGRFAGDGRSTCSGGQGREQREQGVAASRDCAGPADTSVAWPPASPARRRRPARLAARRQRGPRPVRPGAGGRPGRRRGSCGVRGLTLRRPAVGGRRVWFPTQYGARLASHGSGRVGGGPGQSGSPSSTPRSTASAS